MRREPLPSFVHQLTISPSVSPTTEFGSGGAHKQKLKRISSVRGCKRKKKAQPSLVQAVDDGSLAERVLPFGSGVTAVVADLATADSVVRVCLVR